MTQQSNRCITSRPSQKKIVFHFKIMLSSNNDQEKAEKISQEMLKIKKTLPLLPRGLATIK